MEDFLNFKKMVTPLVIKILFWVGVVLVVIGGLIAIYSGVAGNAGGGAVLVGLLWILIGPLVVRIYCELLIVIFTVNDTLTEIRNILRDK